jgi:hypothetical protein
MCGAIRKILISFIQISLSFLTTFLYLSLILVLLSFLYLDLVIYCDSSYLVRFPWLNSLGHGQGPITMCASSRWQLTHLYQLVECPCVATDPNKNPHYIYKFWTSWCMLKFMFIQRYLCSEICFEIRVGVLFLSQSSISTILSAMSSCQYLQRS